MEREDIDTDTIEGKISVMCAWRDNRTVLCRNKASDGMWSIYVQSHDGDWNWDHFDYAVAALDQTPEEIWVAFEVGSNIPVLGTHMKHEADEYVKDGHIVHKFTKSN